MTLTYEEYLEREATKERIKVLEARLYKAQSMKEVDTITKIITKLEEKITKLEVASATLFWRLENGE